MGIGYGVEAFTAVIGYPFKKVNIHKITAGTVSLKKGMLRIIKEIGMQEDGRHVRYFFIKGNEVDVVYAALFRDDWVKVDY